MGKRKVNAYFNYMQQMRRERPDWADKPNRELARLCGESWSMLPESKREGYRDKGPLDALNTDGLPRKKGETRLSGYDNRGRPLVQVLRAKQEAEREAMKRIADVEEVRV